MKLFKICTSQADFNNAKTFKDIPLSSLFVKFVNFIHDELNCNFLSKKIKMWYNDSSGVGERDFSFRFRGKESLSFLRNVPKLIVFVLGHIEKSHLRLRLLQIHLQCINLRKLVSLSVRIVNFDATSSENYFRKLVYFLITHFFFFI